MQHLMPFSRYGDELFVTNKDKIRQRFVLATLYMPRGSIQVSGTEFKFERPFRADS